MDSNIKPSIRTATILSEDIIYSEAGPSSLYVAVVADKVRIKMIRVLASSAEAAMNSAKEDGQIIYFESVYNIVSQMNRPTTSMDPIL